MAKARGFNNSSSSEVDNKLKPIKLTARKNKKESYSSRPWNVRDGLSSGIVRSVPYSTKITNG